MEQISVFDILKIGVGPSSSHTLGPWRAALRFVEALRKKRVFDRTQRIAVDLYGSLSTSLRWKNLDFSISTNYSIGGKNYDGVYYEFMSCYYTAQAKHKDMLRAWRKPGDVTDVPKYTIGETPIVTDDKLVDASYFSIKNITLGYTLPRRWTSKIGFKAARVSASVDNLCIFTHLKGMDPQYSLTGGTSYAYAPTRTVSFNLDLKF